MQKPDVIIIGAGISGLIAARELSRAGKKVLVLEAKDQFGGRIFPLYEEEFGFPAEGGAEFVHGDAPLSKAIMKEAGLTYIPEDGEIWTFQNGNIAKSESFIKNETALREKVKVLKEDMPIQEFLDTHFKESEFASLRNSIIRMVQGYDAADPKRISTFALRDEWLAGEDAWNDGKIKEGYKAFLGFVYQQCIDNGVTIWVNVPVRSVRVLGNSVELLTEGKETFTVPKVVITVPLPVLRDFDLGPELKERQALVDKIGFGGVVKTVIRFKTRFWELIKERDLSKMEFMISSDEPFTWWTQYPRLEPILTGWLAGPKAERFTNSTDEAILDLGIDSLSRIFNIEKEKLRSEIVVFAVVNWLADPYSKGAYSYATPESEEAIKELKKPYKDLLYFAGEVFGTEASSTVEGAIESGLETAREILK